MAACRSGAGQGLASKVAEDRLEQEADACTCRLGKAWRVFLCEKVVAERVDEEDQQRRFDLSHAFGFAASASPLPEAVAARDCRRPDRRLRRVLPRYGRCPAWFRGLPDAAGIACR